jgi:hypothetical protein
MKQVETFTNRASLHLMGKRLSVADGSAVHLCLRAFCPEPS